MAKILVAFLFQMLLTVGAVIFSVRIGIAIAEVKLDDAIKDVLRVEQKVDNINGSVRIHDRELAGLQKEVEQLQSSA
jgi:hypothetical protein